MTIDTTVPDEHVPDEELEACATGLSIGDTRRSPERAQTRARKLARMDAWYELRARHSAEHASAFDPLSPNEMRRAVALVRNHESFAYHMRFASVMLVEPRKRDVLAGTVIRREAEVLLLDGVHRMTLRVGVDLDSDDVTRWEELPGQQPAITLDEFVDIEIETKAHPDVQEALRKRGLDIQQRALVTVDPWSPGNFGYPEEEGRRVGRGIFYMRSQNDDNQYAHPIDGLVALIDLDTLELIGLQDEDVYPVPMQDSNYAEKFMDSFRDDLKPLEIAQPEGASFKVDGWKVSWQKWSFHVGFNQREGLVLHNIRYNDDGRDRPIMYRASLAEMTVPYGDTSLMQRRKNAFDAGEYGLGACANTLELGCDCLGEIYYFSSATVNASGELEPRNNVICLHEEDHGILWKHYDQRTDKTEVRRSRRLVISFIATIGNYEYALYWYFYQDGTMELELKASGIVQTGALHDGQVSQHGLTIGKNLYAPHHQHYFSVRMDPMIDGIDNRVVELNTHADPTGPTNPYGNAFYVVETPLTTEQKAIRDLNLATARSWVIESSTATNALGAPTAYQITPGANCVPYAQPDSSIGKRAAYMYHHLWVTPWREDENYPAGAYPNQNPGDDGLPKWTAADRNVLDDDIVVWYTLGLHHVVRQEDWPVMPVDCMGFSLKARGFFDKNPALDVPPSAAAHCATGHTHCDELSDVDDHDARCDANH